MEQTTQQITQKLPIPIKIVAWLLVIFGIYFLIFEGIILYLSFFGEIAGQLVLDFQLSIYILPTVPFYSGDSGLSFGCIIVGIFMILFSRLLLKGKRFGWIGSFLLLLIAIFFLILPLIFAATKSETDLFFCVFFENTGGGRCEYQTDILVTGAVRFTFVFFLYFIPLLLLLIGREEFSKVYQSTYPSAQQELKNREKEAIASFFCGLFGLFGSYLFHFPGIFRSLFQIFKIIFEIFPMPLIPLILGIAGVVFGVIGLKSSKRNFALLGLCLSITIFLSFFL